MVAGESCASISRRWHLSPDITERHLKLNHISKSVSKAAKARANLEGDDLVASLRELVGIAQNIMANSYNANQFPVSLASIRELSRIYELIGRLTGQLDESTRVNVLVQQQQERDAEQDLMLDRLTVQELAELRRLVAKAQGEPSAPPEAVSVPTSGLLIGGGGNGAESQS
jgi:hypothetical protein